jgi:CheY-like chemotaxis protein
MANMAHRVLIADDDAVVVRAVLGVLPASEGWVLCVAMSGAQALARVREFQPDTVVLDLGLPDMDGLDVCRALKRPQGGPGLRVLVLTGRASPGMAAEALAAGADDYLLKPMSPHVLRRALSRHRGQAHQVNSQGEKGMRDGRR